MTPYELHTMAASCFLILISCIFPTLALSDTRRHASQSFDSTEQFDRVLKKSITTFTFYDGLYTTGRRLSPVKQLVCNGGTAGCSATTPRVIQCFDKRIDNTIGDYQWSCKADIGSAFHIDAIRVSCEGYEFGEDDYILRGSCSLHYKLDYALPNASTLPQSDGSDRVFGIIVIALACFAGVCMLVYLLGQP